MRNKVLGFFCLLACANAFAQTPIQVPSGQIRGGNVTTGKVTGGSLTLKDAKGDAIYGLADATITKGRVVSGRVTGTLSGAKFTGTIADATIEDATITQSNVNNYDTSGNALKPGIGPTGSGAKLVGVTVSSAEVDQAILMIGSEVASAPAKGITYKGDFIIFGTTVTDFTETKTGTAVRVPPGARFMVVAERDEAGSTYLYGAFGGPCRGIYRLWLPIPFFTDYLFDSGSKCDERAVDEEQSACAGKFNTTASQLAPKPRDTLISFADSLLDLKGPRRQPYTGDRICANATYKIKKDALETLQHDRFGFTYGLMVVPFKVFTKDWSVGTGATIGPYLAYGATSPGRLSAFAFSAGLASIPVTQQQNGSPVTHNETGVSLALGYIGTIKDSFNMGFFVGRDRLVKTSTYDYNNRTWFGFQLGFDLSK